jgi:predicted RNA-binding Zn-ribbon protein involved in translation (DUF1610 family)
MAMADLTFECPRCGAAMREVRAPDPGTAVILGVQPVPMPGAVTLECPHCHAVFDCGPGAAP